MPSALLAPTRPGLAPVSMLLAVVALTACGPTEPSVGTTFLDSAGVRLAEGRNPRWEAGEGWWVSPEPRLEIGVVEGPDEYQFTDLVGAVRLGDGRIVVADRGSDDLRYYGSDGSFLSRVGGSGDGPGEFRRLDFVGALSSDSVVTYDWTLRRIQIFDPQGVFTRSSLLDSPSPTAQPDKVVGVVDGSTLAVRFVEWGTVIPDGIVRWPPEILATLEVRDGGLASIRTVPGGEAVVESREGGGYSHGNYIFGKQNEFAAAAGRMAIVSTEAFSVEVLGLDGSTELVIRRPGLPEPATQSHLDTYIENRLNIVFPPGTSSDPEVVANFRRALVNTPSASTLPLLRSVHLDANGNIWVEMHHILGSPPRPFQVFASDGTWLGEVAMPPGFDRGYIAYQAPSFQIGPDFLLGVWRDELDVQQVRMYGLEKG